MTLYALPVLHDICLDNTKAWYGYSPTSQHRTKGEPSLATNCTLFVTITHLELWNFLMTVAVITLSHCDNTTYTRFQHRLSIDLQIQS